MANAIGGGSNVADVANVFDGDMTTYWEPAPPSGEIDLVSQWWFVVDLGRLVFAKKLVVRFVEESLGDPFLLFEVLVSDGLEPKRLQGSGTRAFATVLRTLSRNKSQRVFAVDLTGQTPALEAAPVRFVQFLATGTDGPLGTEITREEYEALAADQGAVQHFKRQLDGREVPVAQKVYELLDEERRGSIRYFRRERPRLAELEVWNEGDELVAGLLDRGGVIATTAAQTLAFKSLIDGDLTSFSGIYFGVESAVANPEKELVFDLGAFYWIDTYRLAYSGLGGTRFGSFLNYRIDFSDGSLAADGELKWTTRATKSQRQTSRGAAPKTRFEGSRFEPIKARFARIQWTMELIGAQIATMAEMQLYGEGFQPEVSLESDLIRLGGSRNLHAIEWDADEPPGTRVLIETRTGDELGQKLHYFKNDGTEVTETSSTASCCRSLRAISSPRKCPRATGAIGASPMPGPRVALLPRRRHGDSSRSGRLCCRPTRISRRHCARSGSTFPIPWRRLCGGRSRPSGWLGSALSALFLSMYSPTSNA